LVEWVVGLEVEGSGGVWWVGEWCRVGWRWWGVSVCRLWGWLVGLWGGGASGPVAVVSYGWRELLVRGWRGMCGVAE